MNGSNVKLFQVTFLAVVFIVCQMSDAQELSIDFSKPGFSKVKPDSGPSVEIEGGFMVPYTTTIPGSEVAFEMIPIPGGEFLMGSPADETDRRDDEGPQVKITVQPFWMGKYEVTWGEYNHYMGLTPSFQNFKRNGIRQVTDDNKIDTITSPSGLWKPETTYDAGDGDKEPAASVSQYAAKQYTKFLSLLIDEFYRLPTEAEWEYACRGGTTTRFYFGDDAADIDKHAWHYDNADEFRHTCGELLPNPFGLYDMYGNVAEWVLDRYSEDGYQRLKGKTSTTEQAFNQPTELYQRVCRGGSYQLEIEDCRSAARQASVDEWRAGDPCVPQSPWWLANDELDSPCYGIGFRLMRPLQAPETRKAKEAFWSADLEEIDDDAADRIDSHGKGAIGLVDPELLKAVKELSDE